MNTTAAAPASFGPSVATFPADVAADLLGLTVNTIRRHCKSGKLEALWLKGTWRVSARGIARALHAKTGTYVVPGHTAAFGDLEVDTLEEQTLRLELFSASTTLRATLDSQGRLDFAYIPSKEEWAYHCKRLEAMPHYS